MLYLCISDVMIPIQHKIIEMSIMRPQKHHNSETDILAMS